MGKSRSSVWRWVTSDSIGGGFELGISFGATKGSITLRHPNYGAQKFHFFEVGAGLGLGLPVSVSLSTEDFSSDGEIVILDFFKGVDLTSEDIEGFIAVIEVSGSSPEFGHSGTAMLFGISAKDLITTAPWNLIHKAPAILWMHGENLGIPSIGGMGYIGYLWAGNVIPDPITLSLIAPNDEVSMSWRNTVKNQPPVVISGDALFDFDRYNLKPSAETVLKLAAPTIASYWGRRIQIQGFTDYIGKDPYNDELSLKRAKTVKEWIVTHNFAKASDVYISGYGKAYPVASNRTKEGRAKNRRIEIQVLAD